MLIDNIRDKKVKSRPNTIYYDIELVGRHKAALVNTHCIYSFSEETLHNWTKLSHDCVNASRVNTFKIQLTVIWRGRVTTRLNMFFI